MSTLFPGPLTNSTITTANTGVGAYTISNPAIFDSAAMTVKQSGRMELAGEEADVVINGVSLTDSLKVIEQRLNILRVNNELEAKWDQLRELGEQYRRLEADIVAKQRMWETLQK